MGNRGSEPLGRSQGVHEPRARWGIIALVGLPLVLFAGLYFMTTGETAMPLMPAPDIQQPSPAAGTAPGPSVENPPLLEIGADEWSWKRSNDSVVVSGTVRNISGGPLRDVVAEVSFFDEEGGFITSAEAHIFPTPIHAGQTVKFEVREAWDPAIREARVGFQEIMGDPIETRWKPPR